MANLKSEIAKAIEILEKGGIVIFPTEAVYGIGCRIDDKRAVKRLRKLRGREEGKPFLVLVENMEMAKKYLQKLPIEVEDLMKKYWPGPLTIVCDCRKDLVPSEVRAGGKTLGVRMPDHQVSLDLIKGVGVPILAPSANFAGEKPAFKLGDLSPELVKIVDYVLKAPCGKYKKPSTVIDCTKESWRILREGAVKVKVKE